LRNMKCYICDSTLSTPKYDRDHEDWEPCGHCMEIVSDCLSDFKDQVIWVEEDLPKGYFELASSSPKSSVEYDFT
jgi:NAD-dependent SIR2 family protein deacetylase